MNQYLLSKLAWQKALDGLPTKNLSEGELKLQKDYKDGLAAAERAAKGRSQFRGGSSGIRPEMMLGMNGDTPWLRAMTMMPLLRLQGNYYSSAYNILSAFRDWDAGDTILMAAASTGRTLEGVEKLSNGLMRDWRVFNIPDDNWYIRLEQLMKTESDRLNAWVSDDNPNRLVREVEERILKDGWDNVRPALSLTIRSWIVLGHVESCTKGNFENSVAFYNKAMKVIKFGRKTWSSVGHDVRGEVFRDTFLRTVQTMHMEPLMKLCARENNMKKRNQLLEELLEEATEILKGVESQTLPPREKDPAHVMSVYDYPKGRSLGMKGFYYRRKLEEATETDEVDKLIEQTAQAYIYGATALPLDDEYHCWFLNSAVSLMQQAGMPRKEINILLEHLKEAFLEMQKIWATSSLATQGRDGYVQDTIDKVESTR
ncbi:hypothetical protein PM082_020603 [Marasmius tenuissimus]|nr:hypothetical protein PM082_020603 [Marasmius tenuissimus]